MVTINFYDQFIEFVGDHSGATAGIDLNNDSFFIELYNSTHVFTPANTNRSQISANALGTAFGYTNPGEALTTVAWTSVTDTQTWDVDDKTWSASGGSIGPADDAVIYDDTSVTPSVDLLMCSIDFIGPETAGDGTDFKITFNGSGVFTIS